MVYYPLYTLMLANIRTYFIISTPEDIDNFRALLGNGDRFGMKLSYAMQPSPDGLAQSFMIGAEFIGDDDVATILGDNIFVGLLMQEKLGQAMKNVGKVRQRSWAIR